MPVIEVWRSKQVVIMKVRRSRGRGGKGTVHLRQQQAIFVVRRMQSTET